MSLNIQLRSICESDLPFIYELYASTREEELKQTGWDESEKSTFLKMQFHLQHCYYQQIHAGEQFSVIVLDDITIGRFYAARWVREIRIIDIVVLPQYRRQGIGRQVLQGILNEARSNDKIVSLHVETKNPALSFYRQLGFQVVAVKDFYRRLEWSAVLPRPRQKQTSMVNN